MLVPIIDSFASHSTPAQTAWMYRKLPAPMARWIAMQRFVATVRHVARHSAFYREAFAARKIDAWKVRTPADLGDFYTTPDDLCAAPLDFVCRTPSIVFESSGTSGRNKQVYYNDRELRQVGGTMAAGLGMMGLRKDDRVVNAFDFSIWIPGLMTHYGLMAAGTFCQAFGKVDPVEVYRRMGEYKYTVVIGEPTWLIRLTQLAESDSPDGISKHPLRLLIGGAEEMPREAIPWMKRVWGGATVKMNYGSVEMASGIGFQPCENNDGYHLDYIDFLPEIFEPDDEGFGEMVFTTLTRRVMPLIRYRTRDVTRIEPEPCACGLPAPRIARLRGRRDELIVASGGNLYPLMFETILRKVDGLTHDWQVVFTLEGVREILTINVETDRDDASSIEGEIHRHASDLYPDLMKNLALGIFELRVVTHRPGNVRTARKLKRMLDRRHFTPVMRSVDDNEEAIEQTNGQEVARAIPRRVPPAVWLGLLAAIAIDTLVQVIWKLAVHRVPDSATLVQTLLNVATQPLFWMLLILFLVQFLNWMLVLSRSDLSYAQPITSLSYITVAICSIVVFHEHLPPLRMAGIGLVLVGVWLVSSGEHRTSTQTQ